MKMRAARMYGYKQPLRLEEVEVPSVAPDEVLVRVGGAGMCRTDWQLVDGYFDSGSGEGLGMNFPITPGHEVAGWIDSLGAEVPRSAGLSEGDQVVVFGSWGDGACRQCHEGNEQLCAHGVWAGFGPHGGYQEYLPVNYRYLMAMPGSGDLSPDTLAPLTDAGLTPYRGLKKLRAAGHLGAGRTVAVNGIGGLGSYGTQYAKLLGGGAEVVAFARSDDKLKIALDNGADHAVNVRDKDADAVRTELEELTGRSELDAVIDCAGSEDSIRLAFALLAAEGAVASVGLIGNRIDIPLFPLVAREYTYFGSFWGNYNDLTEVLALAQAGQIKHTVTRVRFDDVNETLEAIARGEVLGRAVIVYD
ncbi:NAD(P)-dependent alcohol dehydrogenase [Mycolicibacterium sp. S2-37]|uniref:NAD(P)-dependent alcohol dehydrogenase n=1 Tax=Mycolicibacterium sp. S2-37 TaxID=2810297 RepID=UPI001A946BC9|nr:NAD(P)-dependent alcohol dehydrogenase [Mycolicibacterium sp. S2-37]MBO0679602.1 NAD(P)-dependent alcohol dehydrogenase [Mycolicibacterium sp. S2-37]